MKTTINSQPLKQIVLVNAIIIQNGKVLLQQRVDIHPEFNGKWATPTGKVELNEHPDLAVVREVKEELGIDIKIRATIPRIDSFANVKDKYHIVYLSYLCEIIAGEPQNLDDEGETGAIGWFSLAEMAQMDMLRGVMEPVQIALALR